MSWQLISDLVRVMHAHKARVSDMPDIRARSGLLAVSVHGERTVLSAPALVNIAALTLSMERLVVHRLSAGATRTVHETDLHTLPGEPPILLRRAWIVESRRPDREPLFGSTASLAGYPLGGAIYLIGVQYPDGVMVSRWQPDWTEQDLDATIGPDASPMIEDVDAHHDWARRAARFAVVFGLLLEAEGSPIAVEEEQAKRKRGRRGDGRQPADEWITRRVYINDRRVLAPPTGSGEPRESLSTGRMETTTLVRGHMKRQPYGPGRELRKWIYVQSYEARRWVSPNPVRVDVGVQE